VLAALKQHHQAFWWADTALKEDPLFIISALELNGLVLSILREPFIGVRAYTEAAVAQNGLALQFAPVTLRQELQIVTKALAQNGDAFRFVHTSLASNEAVIIAAVKERGEAFRFANLDSRRDLDLCFKVVKIDYRAFEYVGKDLRHHPEIWTEVVRQNGDSLKNAPRSLESDGEMRIAAAETSAFYAVNVLENLKTDLEQLINTPALRRALNWLVRTAQKTEFGRYLLGDVDAELDTYKIYSKFASRLSTFWVNSLQRKMPKPLEEIIQIEAVQDLIQKILIITEGVNAPLFKRSYKREYEADFDDAEDGQLGYVVDKVERERLAAGGKPKKIKRFRFFLAATTSNHHHTWTRND